MDPLRDVTYLNNSLPTAPGAVKSRPTSARPTPVQSPVSSKPSSQRTSIAEFVSLPIPPSSPLPVFLPNHVPQDPIYVPEYGEEIVQHLLTRERGAPRVGDYLSTQQEITERMRTILIDWLIDVHIKFRLHPETFYLAVDIIDRYLSRKHVTRAHLQLVGITAILIAAKHEEIWPPEVKDCVYISANTYTADEVLAIERCIASTLRFRFTVPTPYPIACRMLDCIDAPDVVRSATWFFMDTAAHEYALTGHLPSRIAYASTLLARMTIGWNSMALAEESRDDSYSPGRYWDAAMVAHSYGATFAEIAPIAETLLVAAKTLCTSTSRLQAVRRKYLSSKYHAVALMQLPMFVVTPDS